MEECNFFDFVDLYISDSLKCAVVKEVSDEAFQSLWIEIQLPQKSNIICGIIYRQHNFPKRFQEYLDDKLERLITSKKSIYIMGDFNINPLHFFFFLNHTWHSLTIQLHGTYLQQDYKIYLRYK